MARSFKFVTWLWSRISDSESLLSGSGRRRTAQTVRVRTLFIFFCPSMMYTVDSSGLQTVLSGVKDIFHFLHSSAGPRRYRREMLTLVIAPAATTLGAACSISSAAGILMIPFGFSLRTCCLMQVFKTCINVCFRLCPILVMCTLFVCLTVLCIGTDGIFGFVHICLSQTATYGQRIDNALGWQFRYTTSTTAIINLVPLVHANRPDRNNMARDWNVWQETLLRQSSSSS